MFSYSNNISYSVLSLKLKSGLFVGLIGISSITGIFTVLENRESLKSEVEKYINPVFSFLNKQLEPIQTGSKQLLNKGKQWALSTYEYKDTVYAWIKDINFSQLETGATNIYQKVKSWSGSLWSAKDSILSWIATHISPEQIKQDAKTIYSFFKAIGEMWDMLSTMLDKILETSKNIQGLSSYQNTVLSSLMEIASSSNPTETISNLITTFSENSNLLTQFNASDITSVLQHAGKNPDNFKQKIQELKNKTDNKQWGSYKDVESFMKDLGLEKQYALSQMASKIKAFTVCPSGKTCTDSEEDIIKNFVDLIKSKITNDDQKNLFTYDENTDLSDTNNKLVKLVEELEKVTKKKE